MMHMGKGKKGVLRRLHLVNNEGEIEKTVLEREKIEYEISEYNKKYYKKAMNSIFY